MLIPQFSLRWLLAITAVAGVVFSIYAMALRGQAWAIGVSAGIATIAVLFAVYGLMFLVVAVLAQPFAVLGARRPRTTSPVRPDNRPTVADKDIPVAPLVLEGDGERPSLLDGNGEPRSEEAR